MLKLFVGDEKGEVQGATIPARWCIDKKTIEKFKEEKVEKPYILLVTVSGSQEMTRQLAPLDQLIAYVPFQRPDENTIFATIVWDTEGGYLSLWKKYLTRVNRRYGTDVVDCSGKFVKGIDNSMEFTEVKVMVPFELFAKEYPGWEREWVEFMFSTFSKNQCQYRKRRIMAYLVQPFLLLGKFIINCVVATFLLSCGTRDINFKPLFHLMGDKISDIWANAEYGRYDEKFDRYRESFESVFVHKRNGEKRHKFFHPFAPICPTVLFIVLYLIDLKWHIFPSLFSIIMAVVLIVVLSAATFLFIKIMDWIIDKVSDNFPEKSFDEKLHKYEDERILICNGNFSTNIKDLPRDKQTIHLKFMDLKARVCKPLPR